MKEYLGNLNSDEYSGTIIDRTWNYDAAGWAWKAADPDGRYELCTYDAVGRRLTSE